MQKKQLAAYDAKKSFFDNFTAEEKVAPVIDEPTRATADPA